MTKLFVPTGEGGIRGPFLKPSLKDKFWMAFEKLEIIFAAVLSNEDTVYGHCAIERILCYD